MSHVVDSNTTNYTRAKRDTSWCLKIVEKVSFNNANEVSYVYILNGQKFMKNAKNAKNSQFWRVF